MSSKGLKYNMTSYQKEGVWSAKCKQAKWWMEHVSVLILASKEKVCSVKNGLAGFSKCYRDPQIFYQLPLVRDEVATQSKYFMGKMKVSFYCFPVNNF